MIFHRVMDGPNECDVIHDKGGLRQLIANLDSRGRRFDHAIMTSHTVRSIRFRIEGVEVTWSAKLIEEDD